MPVSKSFGGKGEACASLPSDGSAKFYRPGGVAAGYCAPSPQGKDGDPISRLRQAAAVRPGPVGAFQCWEVVFHT